MVNVDLGRQGRFVFNVKSFLALYYGHASYAYPKYTRGVFYVRREADLMKTAKVNASIMYIFGNIELLPIHAT